MTFLTKKSFDFNHDLNQWLKSARFKSANPVSNITSFEHIPSHCTVQIRHNEYLVFLFLTEWCSDNIYNTHSIMCLQKKHYHFVLNRLLLRKCLNKSPLDTTCHPSRRRLVRQRHNLRHSVLTQLNHDGCICTCISVLQPLHIQQTVSVTESPNNYLSDWLLLSSACSKHHRSNISHHYSSRLH